MHLEIENIHHPQIKNMNLSVYDVGYRAAHLHPEIELILVLKEIRHSTSTAILRLFLKRYHPDQRQRAPRDYFRESAVHPALPSYSSTVF